MRPIVVSLIVAFLICMNANGQNDATSGNSEVVPDSIVEGHYQDSSITTTFRNKQVYSVEVHYYNQGKKDPDSKTIWYVNDSLIRVELVNRRVRGKKMDWGQHKWVRTDTAIWENGKWIKKKGKWFRGPNLM